MPGVEITRLPIRYNETFTAVPMDRAEQDAFVGKTIGELREAGYEDREIGTEGEEIVCVMRKGLFDYSCVVDADFDAHEKAREELPDGGKDFVITGVCLRGITGEFVLKRIHTDGTVEEIPDTCAEYADSIDEVSEK
ncbi:MAG: hypothetical protein IJH38_09575 [Clostridia bacterium]|nr:hypothetical protein [Clostridia bacterium]